MPLAAPVKMACLFHFLHTFQTELLLLLILQRIAAAFFSRQNYFAAAAGGVLGSIVDARLVRENYYLQTSAAAYQVSKQLQLLFFIDSFVAVNAATQYC